jgi:hypothetical protein
MRSGILIALVLAVNPAAWAQQVCDTCSVPSVAKPEKTKAKDPRSEELKRLDAELDKAWLRGDKATLAAALADGMIGVGSSGDVTDKDKILSRLSPAPPSRKVSISAADVRVMFFGDTAVVSSKKTRKWEVRGRPGSKDYRETNTYVRRRGRWVQISSQQSEEPRPYFAKDVAFDLPFDETLALGDKNTTLVLYEFSDYECRSAAVSPRRFSRRCGRNTFRPAGWRWSSGIIRWRISIPGRSRRRPRRSARPQPGSSGK